MAASVHQTNQTDAALGTNEDIGPTDGIAESSPMVTSATPLPTVPILSLNQGGKGKGKGKGRGKANKGKALGSLPAPRSRVVLQRQPASPMRVLHWTESASPGRYTAP